MTESTTSRPTASALFSDPSADVVLLSSDNVAFKLHKIILSLGSAFFKGMFDLPQPAATQSLPDQQSTELDGLPVIDVTEPSLVLDKLFRYCYPLDNPTLDSLTEVRDVLTTALKYELRKVVQYATQRLRDFIPSEPLRVYAIACILSLENEARDALFEVKTQHLQNVWVDELEEITIGRYHRLLRYCDPTPPALPNLARAIRLSVSPAGGFLCTFVPTPAATTAPVRSLTADFQIPESSFPVNCADVVIQTRDGTRFPTISTIIRTASPVLASRLQDDSHSMTRPLVVEDSRDVMAVLLRIYGPSDMPPLTDLFTIYQCILAAKKYGMQKAVQVLQTALQLQCDIFAAQPGGAFSLYIVACHLDMRELALTAAKRTLRTKATEILNPNLNRSDISAGHLYRLLKYQRACKAAVQAMRNDRQWISAEWERRLKCCANYSYVIPNAWACWYDRYMDSVFSEQWPGRSSAGGPATTGLIISNNRCPHCSQRDQKWELFLEFSRYLGDCIEVSENQVQLEYKSD